MKHSLKISFSVTNSHWINIDSKGPFTESSGAIEESDIATLVNAIISEFDHSTDEQKEHFKTILLDWIKNSSEKELEIAGTEKLRDFIYEMF